MVIKVDTFIPESTIGSRYNLIRSAIDRVVKDPSTVLTQSGSAGGRSHRSWEHRSNPSRANQFDNVIINTKLQESILEWILDSKMKVFGDFSQDTWNDKSEYKGFLMIKNTANVIIPHGCIDYIKQLEGNKPDVNKLFKYLMLSTNEIHSDSEEAKNKVWDFLCSTYAEMSSDICVSCPSRFTCASSINEYGIVFGRAKGNSSPHHRASLSWSDNSDQAPIMFAKSTSLIHAFAWKNDTDVNGIFVESKAMNMITTLDAPDELLKFIDDTNSVPYRKLSASLKETIASYVRPGDNQGLITSKINDYRNKNLCENCLSGKSGSCAKDHYYKHRDSVPSEIELKCAYLPMKINECETIIKSYYRHIDSKIKPELFDRFNYITERTKALFSNLKLIGMIDKSFKWKINDKRAVYCSVVDYIEQGKDCGRFNIVLRSEGKVRSTISPKDLLEVNDIDSELRELRQKNIDSDFDNYHYPYLLYFMYTNFYKNQLNDEVNINRRGEGYNCNPILLHLDRDNILRYNVLNTYARSIDYGSTVKSVNLIDFLVHNSKYNSYDDSGVIYKFRQKMEDFMSELKNVDPEVKKISDEYNARYGEPVREIHAYKQKGISK